MKNDWANLAKYAAENESIVQNPNKRVVFIGDSITKFWKIYDAEFFIKNNYINRGISGQTSPQIRFRFNQDVVNLRPNVVVILAGINDIAQNTGPITLDAIVENIIKMCELAILNKIKVVLCSVLPANKFTWRLDILPSDKVEQLNKMIKSYATTNKIVYVDYYSAMVDENKGLNSKFGDDGVHPNLLGYETMKTIVVKGINRVLK